MINPGFTASIYPFSVIVFLTVALVIFALFRLFRFLVQFIRLKPGQAELVNKYIPLIELLVWLLFFIWSVQYLFSRGYLITVLPFVVFLIVIFYLAWFILKDVVAGVIFKTSNHLRVNDHVVVAGVSGKVISVGLASLEIEDNSGRIVSIPFSKIVGNIILRNYPSQSLLSHNFIFTLTKEQLEDGVFQVIEKIRTTILTLPWSSQKKEPRIILENETTESVMLNVTIYSLDETYFIKTEKFLEEKFSGVVSRRKS